MISKFDSLQSSHRTKLGKILEEQVSINTSLNLQNKLLEERITRLESKTNEPRVSDELAKIQSTLSGLDRNLFNICIAINRSNTNEPLRPGGTFF